MSCEKKNGQLNIQDLILRGFKSSTIEDIKRDEQLYVPRTLTKYSKLYVEEASMNQYMLQLKCLLKKLSLLEEGMVYMGKMKPIVFEPIYILAQMQAKLFKFKNKLGHLPKEHRKYAYNLIGNAYDSIIDQCFKGAQSEKCLRKIVTHVAYIDDVIMKHSHMNHENSIMSCQNDAYPWHNMTNMGHIPKLPLKNINKNICKSKFVCSKKFTKSKMKKCNRESNFLTKIEEIMKKDKNNSCSTADKKVSVSIKTDSAAMQFDPNLSGPMCAPKCYSEVENKIRSPWLANTKTCSCRATIEEKLPPENDFHYEVSMRHATTNILSSKNTKETQTTIVGIPSGDYEYSVIDMTYTKERIVNEKTKEEMIRNLRNKQVYFLSETDIFETMSQEGSIEQEESDSSICTVVEDSDCNIKISNVESKPYYKKYKMLYTPNKNSRNRSSKTKSVLIKKETIKHKDEILAYIKELGSILLNSYKAETSEVSEMDTNT